MRRFIGFIGLLLLACLGNVYAVVVNEEDHFFCGFDTEDEYNQWTEIDQNGVHNGNNDFWWDGDWKAAYFAPGTSLNGDDWLISPAVRLTGGKSYVMKVNMYCDWTCKLRFTMGTAATVEAQNVVLAETADYDGDYYLRIALPENVEAGTYHFGVYNTTRAWDGVLYMRSLEVVEDRDGQLDVVVLDKESREKIEGAAISVAGLTYESREVLSDAEGVGYYDALTPGDYTVSVRSEGYLPVEGQATVVSANEKATCVVEAEKRPFIDMTGVVTDEVGTLLAGASVSLDGEVSYTAVTDAEGRFSISNVRASSSYRLLVSKKFRKNYMTDVDVATKNMDVSVVMEDFVANPVNISTEQTERGMFVSWMMPSQEKEIRLNGEYAGSFSLTVPEYVYMGNKFTEPMLLDSVSWAVTSPDEQVDLYVFSLNRDGSLSADLLYEARGVPSSNSNGESGIGWNAYTFSEPVLAPYGCVVAIGHAGELTMANDQQGNDISYTSYDLQGEGWSPFSAGRFFIRAGGKALTDDYSSGNFTSTVWRFKADDKADRTLWTEIGQGVRELFWVDKEFSSLPQGTYQYAIQATYQNGGESEVVYSAEVGYRLYTALTVHVFTDTAIDLSEGVCVRLEGTGDAGQSYTTVVKEGVAVFDRVEKGSYRMTAIKEGLEMAEPVTLVVDKDERYEADIHLSLVPLAPFNLQTCQTEGEAGVLLKWNVEEGLFEDFENMEDFAVNPAGELGWTYADVDGGATYGVELCKEHPYPNMYAPMAFMSFVPEDVSPSLLEYVRPHSGKKVLVDVSLAEGGACDDYLFSPALSFDSDFELRFYAMSGFYGMMGDEKFMVGYTLAGAVPEEVVWITESPQSVGGVWTEFAYTLPKEARHAVIRCVSEQAMFFVLDDISIRDLEPDVFGMAMFDVYVDEELVGSTNQRSLLLENLTEGKHLAKVQTVYRMADDTQRYSAFTEYVFNVNAVAGVDAQAAEMLYTYQPDAGVIVPGGNVERMELIDMQGRVRAQCGAGDVVRTSGYPAGVYVLRLKADGQYYHSKLLFK